MFEFSAESEDPRSSTTTPMGVTHGSGLRDLHINYAGPFLGKMSLITIGFF